MKEAANVLITIGSPTDSRNPSCTFFTIFFSKNTIIVKARLRILRSVNALLYSGLIRKIFSRRGQF